MATSRNSERRVTQSVEADLPTSVVSAAAVSDSVPVPEYEVVVIGAGFSGLSAGYKLRKQGVENFLILDKGDGVGGTWRQNTYPGVEVDIPSTLYSYHFQPNPNWSRAFAPGSELRDYAENCADSFGLRDKLRLNTEVAAARFDDSADLWRITIAGSAQELTARFVISCHGALSTPAKPNIAGLDSFAGRTIYSQDWDHDYSLTDKRVAVIGTGASGIQIIPVIAPNVQRLTVFQRTPIWVFPKVNIPIPATVRKLFSAVPLTQRAMRTVASVNMDIAATAGVVHHKQLPIATKIAGALTRASMRRQIPDPELREKLIPTYGFACKRPSALSTYLKTFQRANVELVTEGITRIVPEGIETADGRVHELDAIVLATGFKVFDVPYAVTGLGGTDLVEYWDQNRMRAYQGVGVPGFPNLFLAPGPYGVVGFSWFDTIELCVSHAVRMVGEAHAKNATRVSVDEVEHQRYFDDVTARAENLVFNSPGCVGSNSYYIDKNGDTPFLRPFAGVRSTRMMRTAPKAYRLT